ncbi:molybdopterin molybdotransferase MoeA [Candidatus Desulfosporosinus nitrosoreducens]|uniref:molybdopterin molybdotransferase MoeA n=1 Tax=Candidatus Desulfosporosinus nitrosoreducens TaxID=3401928 RepID=UPI00280BD0B3|nr:molybdopterin molybdotransferase MoeA [Desulfosporosinus sp. PR]
MKNFKHPKTSRQEALRLILDRSRFQSRVEILPVREALGRVTAQEVLAVNTLPNSPVSRMDGIAIKFANLSGELSNSCNWRYGADYVFCNTGVGIPGDFDTVILIEDVEIDETGELRILSIPQAGQYIRPAGEIMRAGDVLVPEYSCLSPLHLGLLSTGGADEIPVLSKPRVAVLPTGNELVPVGSKPPRGKTVESNGIMMEAQIKIMGGEPHLYPIIRDDPNELVKALRDALAWADMVILNGGSSKGTDDRALEVLETVGEILVYEMNSGPGKHTTLTIAGSKPIVGTVGPTIGAVYAMEWFVRPLICKYLFQPMIEPERLKVKLLDDIPAAMEFAWLEVRQINGFYAAKQIGRLAPLSRQLQSNATLIMSKESKGYKAGEIAEVELRCADLAALNSPLAKAGVLERISQRIKPDRLSQSF